MGFMATQEVITPFTPPHGSPLLRVACSSQSILKNPIVSLHPIIFLKIHIFTINMLKAGSQNPRRFFSTKKKSVSATQKFAVTLLL